MEERRLLAKASAEEAKEAQHRRKLDNHQYAQEIKKEAVVMNLQRIAEAEVGGSSCYNNPDQPGHNPTTANEVNRLLGLTWRSDLRICARFSFLCQLTNNMNKQLVKEVIEVREKAPKVRE